MISSSESSPARRVLAVGLDGASFDLLEPWMRSGEMPVLARLVESGVAGELESVVPPLTPPAWTSALTGVNPGKHGVFNFLKPGFEPGAAEFYGSSDWRAPAIWDYLGARGLRTIALHLPATYPTPAIEGLLVAGLPLTNVDADCTHPPELRDELRREIPGYKLFPDTILLRTDRDAYFRDACETLRVQTEEALYLMEREPWSLLFTLLHMGDSLKHFFWDDMTGRGGDGSRKHYIRDYYREVDRSLGRLVERAGPETHVVVLSDHGHLGVTRAVHLNAWLAREGYFKVRIPPSMAASMLARKLRRKIFGKRDLPGGNNDQALAAAARTLAQLGKAVVWRETKAYAEPPGFVWINLRGRNAAGVVEPGDEYRRVRDEIREGLLAIRDPESGEPVFVDVVTREQAFTGPEIDSAPDLVALPRDGYITEYGVQQKRVVAPVRRVGFNGYHVMEGMVAIAGPEIRRGATLDGARIVDVAPTILHLCGLPAQPAMDGRVLEEAFEADALAARPVRVEEIPVASVRSTDSAAERDRIEQSLRDLGYM